MLLCEGDFLPNAAQCCVALPGLCPTVQYAPGLTLRFLVRVYIITRLIAAYCIIGERNEPISVNGEPILDL